MPKGETKFCFSGLNPPDFDLKFGLNGVAGALCVIENEFECGFPSSIGIDQTRPPPPLRSCSFIRRCFWNRFLGH